MRGDLLLFLGQILHNWRRRFRVTLVPPFHSPIRRGLNSKGFSRDVTSKAGMRG